MKAPMPLGLTPRPPRSNGLSQCEFFPSGCRPGPRPHRQRLCCKRGRSLTAQHTRRPLRHSQTTQALKAGAKEHIPEPMHCLLSPHQNLSPASNCHSSFQLSARDEWPPAKASVAGNMGPGFVSSAEKEFRAQDPRARAKSIQHAK